MSQHDDVNDFLLAGGVASAKFDQPGTAVGGPITHLEKQQQRDMDTGKPKVWDDGKPREQIVIHVQTPLRDPAVNDDDGVRALYVRGEMLKAVRAALRESGTRLETGGTLVVAYTGDGERTRAGFNPPKLYAARYTPPASSVDALLGTPAPAPQYAPPAPPQQQYAPAPVPQPAAAAPAPAAPAAPSSAYAAPAAPVPASAPAPGGQLTAAGFQALPAEVQEMLRQSGQVPAGVA